MTTFSYSATSFLRTGLLLSLLIILPYGGEARQGIKTYSENNEVEENEPFNALETNNGAPSLGDEFGRWNILTDTVDGFGKTIKRPSRLRRNQAYHDTDLDTRRRDTADTEQRQLLKQNLAAMEKSFRESTEHTDGMVKDVDSSKGSHPTFGSRGTLDGVNHKVKVQQMEAMIAAQELQAMLDMSMSAGVSTNNDVQRLVSISSRHCTY